MSQFLGTHHSRLDAKGRVSIPASFRATMRAQAQASGEPEGGGGLVLRSSHTYPCIEGWPPAAFEALANPLNQLETFSQEHDDLAQVLYADAFTVEADKEGRIVLPDMLVAHAGLSDQVMFMAQGRTFQIWEPTAGAIRQKEARERARVRVMTIPGAAIAA